MAHGLPMAKKTPHRLTCQNASKCDRFCCSRSRIAPRKFADTKEIDQKTKRNTITKMDTHLKCPPRGGPIRSVSNYVYGQITQRPSPEFCPHCAHRRKYLFSGKRHFVFDYFWVDPKCIELLRALTNRHGYHVLFFEVA